MSFLSLEQALPFFSFLLNVDPFETEPKDLSSSLLSMLDPILSKKLSSFEGILSLNLFVCSMFCLILFSMVLSLVDSVFFAASKWKSKKLLQLSLIPFYHRTKKYCPLLHILFVLPLNWSNSCRLFGVLAIIVEIPPFSSISKFVGTSNPRP